MYLTAVILAAGKGTRMKSRRPKVLHEIAGRPMLHYVLDAAKGAGADRCLVVAGHGFDEVRRAVETEVLRQEPQAGTAHALLQAEAALEGYRGELLVLCGDTPLLTGETLGALAAHHRRSGAAATVLTARLDDPTGYGRVIRDAAGNVCRIVEQKDATPYELAVNEVNTGIYCFAAPLVFDYLRRVTPDNAQGEYYLTDVVRLMAADGLRVASYTAPVADEILGINDRVQLARAGEILRRRILEKLMREGVTVIDPASTFVGAAVEIGRDTVIYPFTVIEGMTRIGEDCVVGPGARLADAVLGNGVAVQYAVVVGSSLGDGCTVGPFAYVRPGCEIGPRVKIGDFVEVKKSRVGQESKIPHLTYVGDAEIGAGVNVGAGTITCNYDGVKKHRTVIGDGAFIGSNANLVAPVVIGPGAYIGAGSTITKDVPAGALGIARSRQLNIPDWVARRKKSTEV